MDYFATRETSDNDLCSAIDASACFLEIYLISIWAITQVKLTVIINHWDKGDRNKSVVSNDKREKVRYI